MQDIQGIPVGVFGNLNEKEITGYYCFLFRIKESSRFDMLNLLSPLTVLQLGLMVDVVNEKSLDVIHRWSQDETCRVYIIPHTKDESFAEAKERILQSKALSFGFLNAGKITGLMSPTPLDEKYFQPWPACPDWNTALHRSAMLRLLAHHNALPVSTPVQPTMCEFIPEEIASTPTKINYQKSNGKKVVITTEQLEAKISKKRGNPFKYSNGITMPLWAKDFIEGKLNEKTVHLSDHDQLFVEASQDVAVGYNIPPEIAVFTDDNLKILATMSHAICIKKMNGINGFGVVAKNKIENGVMMCMYSGEFSDYIVPIEERDKYVFKQILHDGILWSANQGFSSLRQGNFAGLVNHASEEKCNVRAEVGCYKGLLVIGYVSCGIEPGEQLVVNYGDMFKQGENPLSFTPQGEIVFDKAASTMAKAVNSQALKFFGEKNFQGAKSKFKQAVALLEGAPENSAQKAAGRYNLGSTYLGLDGGKKEKYTERARFFLGEAKKHQDYAKKADDKLATINPRK